jgi:hypothetical protein
MKRYEVEIRVLLVYKDIIDADDSAEAEAIASGLSCELTISDFDEDNRTWRVREVKEGGSNG